MLGILWDLSLYRLIYFILKNCFFLSILFFLSEVLLLGRFSIFQFGTSECQSSISQIGPLCVLPSFPLFSNYFIWFCFTLYAIEIFYITFQTSNKFTLLTVILTSKHPSFFVPLFCFFKASYPIYMGVTYPWIALHFYAVLQIISGLVSV